MSKLFLILAGLLCLLLVTCSFTIFDRTEEVFEKVGLLRIPATNIVINEGELILVRETNFGSNGNFSNRLTVTVLPPNHNDGAVVWTSSDINIVGIDSIGNLSASSNNTGIITVTASVRDVLDTTTVVISRPGTNIVISPTNLNITNGVTGTLAATLLPTNHTDNIEWFSSNTNIFFINLTNGRYTALSPGSTIVTAKSVDLAGGINFSTNVSVTVDGAPTITNHVFSVMENVPTNTVVGMVKASDDMGISTYTIIDGMDNAFAINATNGLLTTAASLNREAKSNYLLTVQVADAFANTAIGTITINIIDVDEVAPTITNQAFSVAENVPSNTIVGMVNASDNIEVTFYSITAGNTSNAFTIDSNGNFRTAGILNRESISNYSLTVQVADAASNTASNTITVNIVDVDEVAPTITNQALSVLENVPSNTMVGTVSASDNLGVTAYTITAGNTNGGGSNAVFAINNSGHLTTVSAIDYETTSNYSLTVQVADAATNTANSTVMITVIFNPIGNTNTVTSAAARIYADASSVTNVPLVALPTNSVFKESANGAGAITLNFTNGAGATNSSNFLRVSETSANSAGVWAVMGWTFAPTFNMESVTNTAIRFYVRSSVASSIVLKVEGPAGTGSAEVTKSFASNGQWQLVTWAYSELIGPANRAALANIVLVFPVHPSPLQIIIDIDEVQFITNYVPVGPATNVMINGGNFTNTVGDTGTLAASVLPTNHGDGAVAWSSASTNVLSINASSGAYSAVAVGNSVVKAIVGGVSNMITVTVYPVGNTNTVTSSAARIYADGTSVTNVPLINGSISRGRYAQNGGNWIVLDNNAGANSSSKYTAIRETAGDAAGTFAGVFWEFSGYNANAVTNTALRFYVRSSVVTNFEVELQTSGSQKSGRVDVNLTANNAWQEVTIHRNSFPVGTAIFTNLNNVIFVLIDSAIANITSAVSIDIDEVQFITNYTNDFAAPIITNHVFSVMENVPTNTVVGMVSASDDVAVSSYIITSGNSNGVTTNAIFAINNSSGQLTTTSAIDYETSSNYSLTVQVADAVSNTASNTVTVNVNNQLELINVTNVADTAALLLESIYSVTTATIGGTTYLFAAGFADSGVSVFSVSKSGALANVTNVKDAGTLELAASISVTTVAIGGTTYLFVAGNTDDGVSVFSVSNDGALINVTNVKDAGTLELDGASSVTAAAIGASNYLFVAGFEDDGVSVFSVSASGALNNVTNVKDDTNTLELDGASSVTTAAIGATNYLFVAGQVDDGVSVFSVSASGALANVANVKEAGTLELDGAQSVTTAAIGASNYLFVAGQDDDGVSVFSVSASGALANVANVTDGGDLELNRAFSVTTAAIGGTTYLFVAGQADNGFSVFSVSIDGILANVANVMDDEDALKLAGASSVTTATIGGTTYLFVAGVSDNGISVFRVE